MRVVLDSNVLVAAMAARGTCAELFAHVLAHYEFAVDANQGETPAPPRSVGREDTAGNPRFSSASVALRRRILVGEVERVLREKIRVQPDVVAAFTRLLLGHATVLEPLALAEPACRDPDDDRILALCREYGAHVLVTGDKDLLVLDPWEAIRIVSPSDFWPLERASR